VTEGNAPLDLSDEVTLYRIVGLNEAKDIEESGGFRFHSAAFEEGKWFATTFENAVTWGYRMPPNFPAALLSHCLCANRHHIAHEIRVLSEAGRNRSRIFRSL
jgi:hypothetical protein